MKAALSESTALSQKSEREYLILRDGIKGMVESWKMDTDRLKEEMRKREERWKLEMENANKKFRLLVEEVGITEITMAEVRKLQGR